MECLHVTTWKSVLASTHMVILQSRTRSGRFPGGGGLIGHGEGLLAPSDPDGRGSRRMRGSSVMPVDSSSW